MVTARTLPLENIGALKTSGVDINGNYRLSLEDVHLPAWGSLNLNFTGTYLRKLTYRNCQSAPTTALVSMDSLAAPPTRNTAAQTRLSWHHALEPALFR